MHRLIGWKPCKADFDIGGTLTAFDRLDDDERPAGAAVCDGPRREAPSVLGLFRRIFETLRRPAAERRTRWSADELEALQPGLA